MLNIKVPGNNVPRNRVPRIKVTEEQGSGTSNGLCLTNHLDMYNTRDSWDSMILTYNLLEVMNQRKG